MQSVTVGCHRSAYMHHTQIGATTCHAPSAVVIGICTCAPHTYTILDFVICGDQKLNEQDD